MIIVKTYGKLSDIVPANLELEDSFTKVSDLIQHLEKEYPQLVGMSYIVVRNKQIVSTEFIMNTGDEIALLPPFSGG